MSVPATAKRKHMQQHSLNRYRTAPGECLVLLLAAASLVYVSTGHTLVAHTPRQYRVFCTTHVAAQHVVPASLLPLSAACTSSLTPGTQVTQYRTSHSARHRIYRAAHITSHRFDPSAHSIEDRSYLDAYRSSRAAYPSAETLAATQPSASRAHTPFLGPGTLLLGPLGYLRPLSYIPPGCDSTAHAHSKPGTTSYASSVPDTAQTDRGPKQFVPPSEITQTLLKIAAGFHAPMSLRVKGLRAAYAISVPDIA
eukprot:1068505-Rhodomonas_salina.1